MIQHHALHRITWEHRHVGLRLPAQALRLLFLSVLLLHSTTIHAQDVAPVEETPRPGSDSTLTYVSDFFSFVGGDDIGRVTFALDANRGRDGHTWQAEHLVVLLHDEQQGWANLQGEGAYDNGNHELENIPNSPVFQFHGQPSTGLTINSPQNELNLEVGPIPERLSRTHHASRYWMGSTPGRLKWKGRVLRGWIIYEHLSIPDFNRLTHRYTDLWTESYGLYAWIGIKGDHLFLHSQEDATRLSPLIGDLVGFSVFNQHGDSMKNLQLKVLGRKQAFGFYQWPMKWTGTWHTDEGKGSITLSLSDLKVVTNFLIGGLAMGIIQGEVTFNGQQQPVYGLAELLI